MAAGYIFPTFCHIGEYGDVGYKSLHRMIAVSQPLNLWAPTSAQLEHASCHVPPKQFIDYVKRGHIRVFGREQWLTSAAFRDSHPFSGARWSKTFDGELKDLLRDDSGKPEHEQRVIAAPPEDGWSHAERYLEDNPAQIAYWNDRVNQKRIPAGTLEMALRHADGDPRRLAQAILRDAWNHGEASRQAGADVRFLLTKADREYLDILLEAAAQVGGMSGGKNDRAGGAALAPTTVANAASVELAGQLLKFLDLLDLSAPRRGRPGSLDKFIGGDGHTELVRWLSSMCERYKSHNTRVLDKAVINELKAQLHDAEFGKPLHDLVTQPAATSVGAIGLVSAIVGFALDPANLVAIGGIFGAAFPVGVGLFRVSGLIPPSFAGPQWPFMYTYGSRARKHQLEHLLYVLNEADATPLSRKQGIAAYSRAQFRRKRSS